MTIKAKNIRVEIGEIPKEKVNGIVYFESIEEMNNILSPKRLELINAVKMKNPESIYDLAKMLKRDQGNVTKDVNLLAKHGFLELEEVKDGERTKVKPTYEKGGIELMIKFGAGAFGIAKDFLENVSEEFKGEKLRKNKDYTQQQFKKTLKPIQKAARKFADKLD